MRICIDPQSTHGHDGRGNKDLGVGAKEGLRDAGYTGPSRRVRLLFVFEFPFVSIDPGCRTTSVE